MNICISGGCGFIGHHLVEHVLKQTDWNVVILDRLTYAANGFDRLRDIKAFDDKRVRVITADISQPLSHGVRKEIGSVTYLVHMAAETHVDNSITDAFPFVQSNVLGTYWMLEWARQLDGLEKMVYFSTDEVFGPAPDDIRYKEWDRYRATNPYSATKAAGEELCIAWQNTHKVPVFITHTMNAYGERQHQEKYIPKIVKTVLAGETLTIHANAARTKAGSRFYIHCRNIADATLFLLRNGVAGDKYNIVGEQEVDNLALADMIAGIVGKPLCYEMVDFHSSRPGHDLRYALDGTKLWEMGWRHPLPFAESLEKTVKWMLQPENARWLSM